MLQIKKMRLPTCEEYDSLAVTAKDDNDIMHWDSIYSWCQDTAPDLASYRAVRGWVSARLWNYFTASNRYVLVGFRPAFEILGSNTLSPDGTIVTVGTLYMGGQPVKVPQNPVWDGDIPDYIPGAKLELREAVGDPAYQVKAIKVGNLLITDRVLLKNISWDDLHGKNVLSLEQAPVEKFPEPGVRKMRVPTCKEWNQLVEITKGDDSQMHWSGIYSWCDEIHHGLETTMVARGCMSADFHDTPSPYARSRIIGFRPAFDVRYPGINAPDGSIVTAGTLYMDGKPVRVPQKPTWDGDIPDYIPGAKLDLRESLNDPAYQMKAIKIGDVMIADRVMLTGVCLVDPSVIYYCYGAREIHTWKLPAMKLVEVEVRAHTLKEALELAGQKANDMGASMTYKTPQEYLAYIGQNPSI